MMEFTSRWSFNENCNEFKSCRLATERLHSYEVQDDPMHDGESAKDPKERGVRVKGFTIWLQPRKELR